MVGAAKMTTVVARTFASAGAAHAAVDELLSRGCNSDAVRTEAADRGTAVSVRAEFGDGLKATRILESNCPVGTAKFPEQLAHWPTIDNVSSALHSGAHNEEAAPLSTSLACPYFPKTQRHFHSGWACRC